MDKIIGFGVTISCLVYWDNGDKHCECAAYAGRGLCEHRNGWTSCPYTCELRQNISCGPPDRYPNAIAAGNWTYISRVTHMCKHGFRNEGGTGLQACSDSRHWTPAVNTPNCVRASSVVGRCTTADKFVSPFWAWPYFAAKGVSILYSMKVNNRIECMMWCFYLRSCTFISMNVHKNCYVYYFADEPGYLDVGGAVYRK